SVQFHVVFCDTMPPPSSTSTTPAPPRAIAAVRAAGAVGAVAAAGRCLGCDEDRHRPDSRSSSTSGSRSSRTFIQLFDLHHGQFLRTPIYELATTACLTLSSGREYFSATRWPAEGQVTSTQEGG